MIDYFELFSTKFNKEEVIEVIQSEDQEKKFKLALQIIFDTSEDFKNLGWCLLAPLDIKNLIDEKFIKDFLLHSSPRFSILGVIKFLDFVVKQNSESLNMAIQKHLKVYAEQKPAEQQTEKNLSELLNVIQILENHSVGFSNLAVPVLKVLMRQVAVTQLPREVNQIQHCRIDIMHISEFFKTLRLTYSERLELLESIFDILVTKTYEPQPLTALGLLIIPDEMINKAIEQFLMLCRCKRQNSRESIVIALNRLILWQRTFIDFRLDQWISRTLTMLNANGFSDVVDDIAKDNITPAFLTLVIPVYQTRMLNVVQALLENAKSTKEMFDQIATRCVNMLKQLEDGKGGKSVIFEPLMELICETLCTINETDFRYRELIQFLEERNRSPSKYISKRTIGPSYGFLNDNARVGLENLGNTCYLNSILQALFMTKQFCREILVEQRFEDRSVLALQELFALMLFSPRPEQNPKKVVNLIRPNDFLPGIQHDSSEFLGSLLDRLHEVEKKRMKDDYHSKIEEDWNNEQTTNDGDADGSNSASSGSDSGSNQNCSSDSGIQSMEIEVDNVKRDISEVSESKDKIVDNTQNLYQTYIQRIFGGKISTRYLCSSCNGNSVNIDSFRDLQLSFPEKNEDDKDGEDTQYNVQQLLEFYFTTEELTLLGDNQYHCDNCKILCNGIRCSEILEPPRNLILTLKHFRYDSRHHTRSKLLYRVFHDEVIRVNVKESFATNRSRDIEYMLYAAVIHSGTSLDSGHYYTIAREGGNTWFKFNDSFVTKSSLDELRSLITPNTPYILFYQRLSTASSTIVNPESASTSSTQPINDNSFPKYEELSIFLKNLIEDDKSNFEMMKNQQHIQHTVIASSRYDHDDNNDRGSGSSGFNNGMDVPRFIY